MAQIIKHRRGSLEALSAVTSSLQKGELVIASGSSNLSVTNGASIVFAVPENGQVQAVNRILVGDNAPNTFAAGTYNGMLKGVPYYASGSSTLYLLGEGANEIPNLVGNIQPFSASVASSINALSSSIGSGAIGTSVAALNTFSASTLVSLGELNAFSASQLDKDSALATYTASVDVHISNVNTFTASADGRLDNLESTSASVNTSISNINSTTASLNTSVDNLNSFTSSFSQSVATSFSASAASVTTLSASVASVTGDFSASVATQFSASDARELALSTSVDSRLDVIESKYATTGSNIFLGNQTITGSLYITQDLVVYGSSSLLNVTASRLDLGDNTIVLNTATPAVRFAGIDVIDSGSTGATGSLYWDSLNNHWLYVHPSASGENYSSARLISGPQNSGSLGDEAGLTVGKLVVAIGDDHIGDSIVTQAPNNSKITIGGNLDVEGAVSASTIVGIGNVASFSQSIDSRLDTIESSIGSGGSLGNRVDALETSSAELNSFSSSAKIQLSNLESTSASVNTSISNLNSTTASLNVSVAELNSFSASAKVQLSNLETTSASVNTSVSSLNTFSSSTLGRLTELESKSASVDVSISNINSFTSSFSQSVATSFSASAASVTALSASVASVTGDFSSSVATSFSQSSYNLTQLSSSVATTISNLDSAGYATDVELSSVSGAIVTTISNLSSSVATSFSASSAADAGLGARITTLEGTGTIQGLGTGNNVTFAKVTTTGDVVVGGDLVVQGNTVTLNTSQLIVEDKVITLASGSTSSETADGAGFEIAGANANFVYQHSTTSFTSSVALIAPAVTASVNLGSSAGNSKRVAFRNTNGNLDLVPTASVAGDLLQWDGSDFVMSNVIDGGSF
jgi:uncharacterized coiled-coil protein SlyX